MQPGNKPGSELRVCLTYQFLFIAEDLGKLAATEGRLTPGSMGFLLNIREYTQAIRVKREDPGLFKQWEFLSIINQQYFSITRMAGSDEHFQPIHRQHETHLYTIPQHVLAARLLDSLTKLSALLDNPSR